MTDELFVTPEHLSPREAWKRKHGITVYQSEETGRFLAKSESLMTICHGDSELAAFENLVAHMFKRGIPDWRMEENA